MAHKTLIGGTAYEIGGGKTLVNGTAYSIDKGKTLVDGTAYEVGFAPATVTLTIEDNSALISFDGFDSYDHYGIPMEVPYGTVVHCTTIGYFCSDRSYISVNGEVVVSGPGEYDYIATKNATIITNNESEKDRITYIVEITEE